MSEIINHNEDIIGYKDNSKIKPLSLKFPEYMCGGKKFLKNITISSEINSADFFEKYNKIWKKIEKLMGIEFERKPPSCNDNTCATKIKTLSSFSLSYYQDIIIPGKEVIYKFSSISILHSVVNKDNKYYPGAFMEEYKYERMQEVPYFDNDSDSDSDSNIDIDTNFEE